MNLQCHQLIDFLSASRQTSNDERANIEIYLSEKRVLHREVNKSRASALIDCGRLGQFLSE